MHAVNATSDVVTLWAPYAVVLAALLVATVAGAISGDRADRDPLARGRFSHDTTDPNARSIRTSVR